MYIYFLFFIFGSVFASFIHLYATRLSAGQSIITPRSHCTACNHKLAWYELIPILSYIMTKGRCRKCGAKIGLDSLCTEIVTGLLFVLVYHVYGLSFKTLLGLILVLVMMSIFITDFKEMIILDSTLIVGGILIYLAIFLDKGIWDGIYKSLLYGVFAFILMFLVKVLGDAAFKRESLGGGDIKFAFLMGSVLPYNLFLIALVVASMSALPYALYTSLSKGSHELPFGPFLALGLFITFLFESHITEILNILIN